MKKIFVFVALMTVSTPSLAVGAVCDQSALMVAMGALSSRAGSIDRDLLLSARELRKTKLGLRDREQLALRLESYRRIALPLVPCSSAAR